MVKRAMMGSCSKLIEGSRILIGEVKRTSSRQATHAPPAQVSGDWRPTNFMRVILALHVLAVFVLAFEPVWWPWILSGLLALHFIIGLVVPLPRNALIGANITRLPQAAATRREIALTFDDGPNPQVTPQVLDLLDAQGARATFFCIARHALAYPELVREIVRRGHHVENHSHGHSFGFAFFGYGRLARDIDAAQTALTGITGRPPRFFRAPAGVRGPFLDLVLQRRGLRHTAWTRRGFDAIERDPARVLSRLTRNLAGGDVLLLHDGSSARTRHGTPVVLDVLPELLDQIKRHGLKPVTLSAAFAGEPIAPRQDVQASPGAFTTSANACTGPARSSASTP